jgi:TonB-dependent starch-binding outer membrane protein SusC
MTTYGYNSDPLTYANIDFVNMYPTLITGNPEGIPGTPSFTRSIHRFISLYSNASYTLMDKYSLSFSGRRDGANVFGATTNDRWKPLWSTGLSWDLSRENFYKSHLFPELKVRVTYGNSGNVDLRKTPLPVLGYGPDPLTNLPAALINQLNDPSLRWEQVSTLNFGAAFSLKDEMITGSIEFYKKMASDLYGETSYDYTTFGGQSTITKNVASMQARGVDVMIRSKNLARVFKWSTSLLLNYYKDKTTDYFTENAKTVTSLITGGQAIFPVVGKPLYSIAANKWGGLDASGNPQGFVDGELSTDYAAIANEGIEKGVKGNIVYVGTAIPTVFGSLINSFSWRAFSLDVNISYKFGYYFQKPTIDYLNLIGNGIGHSDFSKRWQQPGDEKFTDVPAFMYPFSSEAEQGYAFYQRSEALIVKADHIRLQYVNLNYSFGGQPWSQNIFKDLQVFMNVSNIGILWRANKEKLDPDYPATLTPGRSFAIGVRGNL